MRFILGITMTIVAIVAAYVLYLKITYIDEEINIGSGYGFSIGDKKDTVYQNAKTLYVGKEVFIRYPIRSDGYGPPHEFTFSDVDYEKIKDSNEWEFYFDKMDSIRLSFEGEHLVSIYRHRQYFELP